jgi:hypothetical protein
MSGRILALACLLLTCLLLPSGCAGWFRREPPRPGRTTLGSPLVILPAETIGNYLLIEARLDRGGPYRFLVDTGSSTTLVSPALGRRTPDRNELPPASPRVRVTGADGRVTELPPTTLRRLELAEARFEDVPALLFDCAPLSAHLGMRIDGVLGFPLFRETLLTLDYPGSRVLLQAARSNPLVPGTIIGFDDASKTPLIQVRMGNRSIVSLIDSGSDATFSLNPIGLEPAYVAPPRTGATVATLSGDRVQQIARLAEPIALGNYLFERPIVDLTDYLSTIGGGMLKYFSVTFDQEHNRVTFYRESREPITMPSRRTAGVSFNKTPAYWKVVGVIPASPATQAGIQAGDLVTRINGEPVARWDLRRYEQVVATADAISLTLLNGATESEPRQVKVFEMVP